MENLDTTLRAFIGIPLEKPIEELLSDSLVPLKVQLNKNISEAHELGPKIRWVKPENWHITLAFLGQISEDEADHMEKILAESLTAAKPFTTEFKTISGFPRANSPIIAAVLDNNNAFQKLYEQIQETCKIAGLPRGHRPFKPHITLARIKHPGDRRNKKHRSGKLPIDFRVPSIQLNKEITLNRVQLFKSHLSPEGSRYETLAEFLLTS
jgi:2'-5' RNA ligase